MWHLYEFSGHQAVAKTKQRAAAMLEVPMADVERIPDQDEVLCRSSEDDEGFTMTAAELCEAWGEECLLPQID